MNTKTIGTVAGVGGRVDAPASVEESDRDLFTGPGQYPAREMKVWRCSDAIAHGRGPLHVDGDFHSASFATIHCRDAFFKRKKHWRLWLETRGSIFNRLKTPALWITDNWSCGYFHWICETLPRLVLASRFIDLREMTLLLPARAKRLPFIEESLRLFSLGRIRYLNRFERLRCDDLFLASQVGHCGCPDFAMLDQVVDLIQAYARTGTIPERSSPPSIGYFLRRRDAVRRRLVNEDRIAVIASKHGIEPIDAERLSWQEQIALFSNARVLVATHGAGLVNCLAMRRGSTMVEFRDGGVKTPDCYPMLAALMNHRFEYLRSDGSTSSGDHHRDMRVDEKKFESILQKVTSRKVLAA
ncbi:MAG: glycosyltransferase family 61 protein [Planctomycetota bacterium]